MLRGRALLWPEGTPIGIRLEGKRYSEPKSDIVKRCAIAAHSAGQMAPRVCSTKKYTKKEGTHFGVRPLFVNSKAFSSRTLTRAKTSFADGADRPAHALACRNR